MIYSNLKIKHFILLFCLILLTPSAFAQQNFGKIKGTITTSDGELAVGVNYPQKHQIRNNK